MCFVFLLDGNDVVIKVVHMIRIAAAFSVDVAWSGEDKMIPPLPL
jgi:hypothetical protein